jgi:hypothetical protein
MDASSPDGIFDRLEAEAVDRVGSQEEPLRGAKRFAAHLRIDAIEHS